MNIKELKKEEKPHIPQNLITMVCIHHSEFVASNPEMEIGAIDDKFKEIFKSTQDDFAEYLKNTTDHKSYNPKGEKTQVFWKVGDCLLLSWGSAYPDPDKIYYLHSDENEVKDENKLINHMTDADINYIIDKETLKKTKWIVVMNIISLISAIYFIIVNPEGQQTLILAILLLTFVGHLYVTDWEKYFKNKFNK